LDYDQNLFCELKHLTNTVNIESNEMIKVWATEIIMKTFEFDPVRLANYTNKKISIILKLKTKYDG